MRIEADVYAYRSYAMPAGQSNPPGMYAILRQSRYWEVSFRRGGQRFRKTFFISTYGEVPALQAAKAWRDATLAAHPPDERREMAKKLRADNKTGIAGVYHQPATSIKAEYWMAFTQYAPGQQVRRLFSVKRYGERARELAIAERALQLQQMEGRVVHNLSEDARTLALRPAPSPDQPPPALPDRLPVMYFPSKTLLAANRSGISGVFERKGYAGRSASWVARTHIGERKLRKTFSVEHHGEERAKELAIAERERQLKEKARYLRGLREANVLRHPAEVHQAPARSDNTRDHGVAALPMGHVESNSM